MEAYDMVMRHLNDEPSKPVLLLGPINSGKSALLTKIMDQEILRQKPVIVVDEVNDLTRWKHKDVEKLKSLLNFLRRTCKEKERAHIVLASADFFMVSWLQSKGLDATQRRVEVLVQQLGRRRGSNIIKTSNGRQ
ncbi:hypothetical protein Ndes2437A_g07939 [Nannochloris sp. 'desiccata']